MEKKPGDGDDRKRERRGYRFRLFNFFLLGQWAYFIFTRMRNIIQANRRRFVRRRWGIRLMGTGKPIEKSNQRCHQHQRGDGSSSSQDEYEETSGSAVPQESVAIVHQSAEGEGEGSAIAGPSGLEKISSKEDTSTDVTEAESKEATDVQEKTITTNTSTATAATSAEGTSDDIDEITLYRSVRYTTSIEEITISVRPQSPLVSEDSSNDEEEHNGGSKLDTNEKKATE